MKRIILILFICLLLCGCAKNTESSINSITCSDKDTLVKKGAVLIDVREDYEYNEEHLDNAINIPYTVILDNIDKYASTDSDIILYCKSGKRASIAALTLKEAGYKHIYNLGGISNCKE